VPEVKVQLPETPDNEWKDTQLRFDGQWMPDVDGALMGPNNYQTLENLRYKDSGLEGVNGYTRVNETTAVATYTAMKTGHQLRTEQDIESYILGHFVKPSDGQGRVLLNTTDVDSTGDFDTTRDLDTSGNAYWEDSSVNLMGRFSDAPQGNVAYCNGEESAIFGGDEQRLAAAFTVENGTTLTFPIDVTKALNNKLSDSVITDYIVLTQGAVDNFIVMTTRPIQSLKIYLKTPNPTADTSLTVKTWTGAALSADISDVDGTMTDTTTLAKDGVVTLDAHTESTAKPMHFEELYLYSYVVSIIGAGCVASIYNVTVDMAMQDIKDVWDGVYRQPIQWQLYNADTAAYYDYTLQVNESSDVSAPVGGDIDGMLTTGFIYIMFEDKMAGIRMTMLGDFINETAASTLAVKYWDGNSWEAVGASLKDGTAATTGIPFSQSGLVSWTPSTAEQPRTLFGSFGYVYQLAVGDTLSGTAASMIIDVCTGVPSQLDMKPFDWSALYGTRLCLGSYSQGNEANRMDYSVANAPDVWNGFDSSDDSRQSLFFGNNDKIVGATQIYNRFGASVYSMLLVLKKNEVYILVGETPDDFIIYPVAKTVGCVAPYSIATAEVGLDLGNGLTRNIAIWLSHSGPVMFDGAVLTPIKGVRSYFDPNDTKYIDFSLVEQAQGWIDPNYKEYNLLIPSGTASENNVWLVYDLIRRKWYTKKTGTAEFVQTGFEVADSDTGERMVYGGIDTGYMVQLENGNNWDDGTETGIEQKVKTGDFFPSNNIWDETVIRKFKIFIKKLSNSSSNNYLEMTYYTNTENKEGSGVIFQDSDSNSGLGVDFKDTDDVEWSSSGAILISLNVGLQRLIKVVQDLNRKGWAHAFEFSVTTDDVSKGFQPIAWGIRYRIERKDDTSTGVSV
jgi:hypothetical protein